MKRKVVYLTMFSCIILVGCRSKKEVSYNKSIEHRVFIDKGSGTESTTVSYPVDSITGHP